MVKIWNIFSNLIYWILKQDTSGDLADLQWFVRVRKENKKFTRDNLNTQNNNNNYQFSLISIKISVLNNCHAIRCAHFKLTVLIFQRFLYFSSFLLSYSS